MSEKNNKKLKILLVEDDESHSELIRRSFESSPVTAEISVTTNLAETCGKLNDFTPDLAIVDYLLQDGKGTEILKDENLNITWPVLIMTSYGDEKIAVEAIRLGAIDYVVKTGETLSSMPEICLRVLRQWGLIMKEKRAEEKYKAIFESSKDAILMVDLNQNILEWNNGAEALYGYKREEVVGKFIPIVPKDKMKELRIVHEKLLNGEHMQNFETRRKAKNGTFKDVVITLSPIKDEKNNIIAVSSIARDITTEKKLKRQMQQTEKLTGIGQLAAGIAHQLNTPLASIRLSAQMLEDAVDNNESLHDVKKIVRQTEYCSKIINKLLEFSRPPGAEKRWIRLRLLINDVEKLLEKVLSNKDITIKKEFTLKNDKILANKNQIEQVVFNLISNAVDAMPNGGVVVIAVEVSDDNKICVKISDTGPGIDDEHLHKIFDPFFTTKKIGQGTGLGLSICYGLVEENEGTIDVESAPGKGATFTIKFPLTNDKSG